MSYEGNQGGYDKLRELSLKELDLIGKEEFHSIGIAEGWNEYEIESYLNELERDEIEQRELDREWEQYVYEEEQKSIEQKRIREQVNLVFDSILKWINEDNSKKRR